MDSLVKAFAPDEEPPPLSEADTLRSYGAELPSSGSDQASAKPNAVLAYLQHREILVPSYVAFVVKSLRNLDASTLTIDLAFTLDSTVTAVRISSSNTSLNVRNSSKLSEGRVRRFAIHHPTN